MCLLIKVLNEWYLIKKLLHFLEQFSGHLLIGENQWQLKKNGEQNFDCSKKAIGMNT